LLYPQKLSRVLINERERFLRLLQQPQDERRAFESTLDELRRLSAADLEGRLQGAKSAGALPSEEYGRSDDVILPFGLTWHSHAEAQAWALEKIADVTTLAVDGSEIVPSRYYNLSLGAVQVGWFENQHRGGWAGQQQNLVGPPYVKDVDLDLVYAADVGQRRGRGFGFVEEEVKLRRFLKEIDTIVGRMAAYAKKGSPAVVFFDGTLVVSFASAMPEHARKEHIGGIVRLLRASEEYRVPVVGYVDASDASDLVTMLAQALEREAPKSVSDAYLLAPRMRWGDRSKAFVCARDDILRDYWDVNGERSYQREVIFCYLKASSFGTLARLELPRWVLRAGLLDRVVDVVRAEIIPSGHGYPYCLEAAHELATLRAEDREMFYAACHNFAAEHGVVLSLPPKAFSKRSRQS